MFRVITINMIVLFAFGFFLLLFIIMLLWILVPAIYGLPPVPTKPGRIQKALKLANLQPNETLYDLGAGDGRVLFIAARDFGAKAVGLEIGPVQCALIWLRATANGFGNQIQIHWGNFYKADLKDADVVFVYATTNSHGFHEFARIFKSVKISVNPWLKDCFSHRPDAWCQIRLAMTATRLITQPVPKREQWML